MSAKMFVKMSILLIPSALLLCSTNLVVFVLGIGWIPASYLVAKKWHSKTIDRIAKCSLIKRIIDA